MIQGKPLRLPLEVLLLVIRAIDSKSALLAWCCLCHTFHDEAERLLYREISVSSSTEIRKIHRALERGPQRCALVRTLRVRDYGRVLPVIPILNEMLLKLTNLAHLATGLTAYQNAKLFHTVLVTLNKCSFALESFEPRYIKSDVELHSFLIRQSGITTLDVHAVAGSLLVPLPQDALPRLKYVATGYHFFLKVIRAPRQITHLCIGSLPEMEGGLRAVLSVVGHQLVSLACDRPANGSDDNYLISPPTVAFKVAALPCLRFLEVEDLVSGGVSVFLRRIACSVLNATRL